jgi:hypothetical protein
MGNMEMTLGHLVKGHVRNLLQSRRISLTRVDELTYLADKFGTDKGTLFSSHGYTRIYKRLFDRIRYNELTLVEIGLHRLDADQRRASNAAEGVTTAAALSAPSLEMWRVYFPRAHIYGLDIDDFSKVRIQNCTIMRGDMSSHKDLGRLTRTIGKPIDILIDEASHLSHHQQIALGSVFPHIRSGGIYIIEDLHWQDPTLERENVPKTRDILRRLQIDGVLESPFMSREQQSYVQENLSSLRLFDSQTPAVDDPSDALAVLVKK